MVRVLVVTGVGGCASGEGRRDARAVREGGAMRER